MYWIHQSNQYWFRVALCCCCCCCGQKTSLVDTLDCADKDAEVEDFEEMDADWDGSSDDENGGYEQPQKQ